jgi:hypothetical protein
MRDHLSLTERVILTSLLQGSVFEDMPTSKKSDPETYSKPELRDKIKKKVTAGEKGGSAGQWSARKAQLVTQEYERAGGGYKKPRGEAQKSLKKWGEEKWTTADGEKARRKGGTARYLPAKAWDKLTPKEKALTNKKKSEGSKAGKQFVANTTAAKKARKKATKTTAKKTVKKATKKKP